MRRHDTLMLKKNSGGELKTLDDLGKVRPDRAAGVIGIVGAPARTIGGDLVRPGVELGVEAVARDQAIDTILTAAAAFIASDPQDLELADDVAKGDGAVFWHADTNELLVPQINPASGPWRHHLVEAHRLIFERGPVRLGGAEVGAEVLTVR